MTYSSTTSIKSTFLAKHHLLQKKMNPALKMLAEVTDSSRSFLVLWDEDFQQIYSVEKDQHTEITLDINSFKSKIARLQQEVIYVPDFKLHTLFNKIDIFNDFEEGRQLLIYPLVDDDQQIKGMLGIMLPDHHKNDFDQLFQKMESLGEYINSIFHSYLDELINHSLYQLNFDNLPSSFFEAEINQDAEILDVKFSKHLMRKHPAFEFEESKSKRLSKLLCMPLSDFYENIRQVGGDHNMEYVYGCTNKTMEKRYYLIKLYIKRIEDGRFKFFGVLEDFNLQKAYSTLLDQIIFDISHIMRRPVVTMKGLTNLIDIEKFDRNDLQEISSKIKTVSEEMEDYIRSMFRIYEAKQDSIYHLG
ncbi:hypothetical protein [Marivirga arenosa]|uniref:GAF domain-containing protein n=1 Tax=Marivirga arenosa TaxID=3059076 RepID=A0AA51ZV56_9BACT|nr:hypothetical protein [Marivirga sp. BKB1-2]WNB17322.1 hypothetical protein QYS47_33595 [Marivirga sp. BKB1-2]